RLFRELDALRRHLLVVAAEVVGHEHATAEHPGGAELLHRIGMLGRVRRATADRHQHDPEVGLRLRPDGEPAELAHPRVVAALEAELVDVEVLRAVLIEDVDRRVRELVDHAAYIAERRAANFFKRARCGESGSTSVRIATGFRGSERTDEPASATRAATGRCGGESSTRTIRGSRTRA